LGPERILVLRDEKLFGELLLAVVVVVGGSKLSRVCFGGGKLKFKFTG